MAIRYTVGLLMVDQMVTTIEVTVPGVTPTPTTDMTAKRIAQANMVKGGLHVPSLVNLHVFKTEVDNGDVVLA